MSKKVSTTPISKGKGGVKKKAGKKKTLPKKSATKKPTKAELRKLEIFNKFIEYYALPEPEQCDFLDIPYNAKLRKYEDQPTMKKFAEKFDVSPDTLTDWKKRDDFQVLLQEKRREWGKDRTSNVLSSLYRRCVKYGMSYDVETYLAYFEGWDKKKAIEVTETKFDMDDVRAILAPLPKKKQEEFYAIITELITEAETTRGDTEVSRD